MLRVLMTPPKIPPTKLKLTCHEYGYYVNKNTKQKEFGVVGERKLQEFVHSFVDSCDYSVIMNSLMPSPAEFDDFADVLDIADSISDVNDILPYASLLEEQFNNMPLEVKTKYENNYQLFASAVINGSFADYIAEKFGTDQSIENSGTAPATENGGQLENREQSENGNREPGKSIGQLSAEFEALKRQIEQGGKE